MTNVNEKLASEMEQQYSVKTIGYVDEQTMNVPIMMVRFSPAEKGAMHDAGYRGDYHTLYVNISPGAVNCSADARKFANELSANDDNTLKPFLIACDQTNVVWDVIHDGFTYTRSEIESEFGDTIERFR